MGYVLTGGTVTTDDLKTIAAPQQGLPSPRHLRFQPRLGGSGARASGPYYYFWIAGRRVLQGTYEGTGRPS